MTRQLNDYCSSKLQGYEAYVGYPYDDADPKPANKKTRQITWTKDKKGRNVGSFGGVITIGYGHTGNDIRPEMTWTEAQAKDMLTRDLQPYLRTVESSIKVDLNDYQFGALVMFCYNVGRAAFAGSSLVKKLNSGDYECVPLELMKWTRSMGKPNKGLVNRRSSECGVWVKFEKVAGSAKPTTPRKSVSAPVGAVGTGAAGSGLGLMSFVNDSKETLSQYTDIKYIQYAVIALTVSGLCLTGYAAWKRWRDNKA